MRPMVRIAVLAFVTNTVLACGTESGDSEVDTAEPAQPATQVIDGAHRAMGGEEVVERVRATRFYANASGPGGDYGVTVHSSVEGPVKLEFSMGFAAAVETDGGWIVPGPDAATETLSDTMETFVRGHDLLMNALHPERGAGSLSFVGEELFNEVAAIRLDGTDRLGAPISFYYSQTDTLPLGFRLVDHVRGAGPVTTSYHAWQPRGGGLRLPTQARFVQGDEVFEYEISEIETHETVDPTVFMAPAGANS